MPTVLTIYDSPDSVNVNDPEATLTVYEMFIGVGPTGATGATGPAGAAAVAGVLPSEYVEMTTARTVTSATLVDITGVTADITLDSTVNIAVFMDCEVSSDGVCDLGLAISINGTDHDVVTTHLNGSTDNGKVTVIHRTATPLAAGTYTVKGRFQRSSGTATPQVDRADFLVFGLQGAQGADGADGVDGANGTNGTDASVTNTTTAENDMIFGDASNDWVTKTLAEGKGILGVPSSASIAEVTTGTDTDKFVTPDALMNGVVHVWGGTISNPQAVYARRPQLFIDKTTAAVTVTSIFADCNDPSPTAEIAWDLKFADDMHDGVFANATVVDVMDTTNGTFSATSGFDDATIPANKFVYIQFDSSPHVDIKDILVKILYTVD